MPYDQELKELLRTFFAAFTESFFPEEAARLDLSQVTFLEKEATTDVGRGRRREMDLVARAPTRDGPPELIIVLVELQARREADLPERLFEYYTLLRRVYRLRVLPIVLYVQRGRGSERWEEYEEAVFDEWIVRFRFRRLRLRSLKAMEAMQSGEPVVCALAVLMDRRGADLALLKATGLQRIGQSGLDEARRWILANFIETYLPLSGPDEQRYHQLLAEEEYQMAKLQDYETWREQQRQEGRAEGRAEGQFEAKREAVLTVLRARFSPVPEEWVRRVETIQTLAELDALFLRLLQANSLDELGDTPPR